MHGLVVWLALGWTALTGCTAGTHPAAGGPALPARWRTFLHVPGVVDLAGPHADGSFTVAAAGHLFRLAGAGVLTPFARGTGGYSTATGPEPYIAVTGNDPVAAGQCPFPAKRSLPSSRAQTPGVILIDAQGQARRFAGLPRGVTPNGIAFDGVGRFQHRLLVTARSHAGTDLFAVDCNAGVSVIASRGTAVEGGIVVAPRSFGRFGGDLIAPDETTGRLFAFQPDGSAPTLADSALASGGDIGVGGEGFVPPRFSRAGAASLADRFSAGNAHPGTNSILQLPGSQLARAGVHPGGDLLVATEGGAKTIAVRCRDSCTVTHIADGPAVSHSEGHIVFAAAAT